jgi:phage shock protein A
MKSAISAGRDDIASTYALKVESSQRRIAELKGELDAANRAYEKSLEVKKAFMRERERKIKEAQEAMRAHERSQWQAKVADTMQSFEVGGVAQTHDEMLSRLNEKTAINEAKMEIAVDSIDTSMLKIEEEAEKIRANDLLAKYKMEMGIGSGAQTQSQDQLRESN